MRNERVNGLKSRWDGLGLQFGVRNVVHDFGELDVSEAHCAKLGRCDGEDLV